MVLSRVGEDSSIFVFLQNVCVGKKKGEALVNLKYVM
jgi:hypothetical protein